MPASCVDAEPRRHHGAHARAASGTKGPWFGTCSRDNARRNDQPKSECRLRTEMSALPPRLSTRATSSSRRSGSGVCSSTWNSVTTSTLPSGSGSFGPSISSGSTGCRTPSCRNRSVGEDRDCLRQDPRRRAAHPPATPWRVRSYACRPTASRPQRGRRRRPAATGRSRQRWFRPGGASGRHPRSATSPRPRSRGNPRSGPIPRPADATPRKGCAHC